MLTEDLEFSISQYIDDSLPPLEMAALEQRFATDVEARRLLDEYQRLNAIVKGAPDFPEINWKLLAVRISDAVAEEEAPVRNYSMKWAAWTARAAVAAAVVLAAGVYFRGSTSAPVNPVSVNTPAAVAVIEGPKVEVATVGSKVAEITIGPVDEQGSK